jgi:flagellar biosynthesis protein FlhF
LNIRKFVGATSRDALRLVREALGSDAVVLSNRAIEDGTVEIVALADSDLAAISHKGGEGAGFGGGFGGGAGGNGNSTSDSSNGGNHGSNHGSNHSTNAAGGGFSSGFGIGSNSGYGAGSVNPGAATSLTTGTGASAAPLTRPAVPPMQANPYASGGMPDVFSSVFGASPEAGTERMSASNMDGGSQEAGTLSVGASHASAAGASASRSGEDARVEIRSDARLEGRPGARLDAHAARPESRPDARIEVRSEMRPEARLEPRFEARPEARPDIRSDIRVDRPVTAPPPAIPPAPARPRTMAETNPWLIDHARRIAAQDVVHTAKPVMTPSAAMARGLGATVDRQESAVDEATPDWAREAAQLAARRAAQRAAPAVQADVNASPDARKGGTTPLAGLPASAAAAVTESIKARMEQIVNETVMNELASMRGMMEEQFTGLLWADHQRRSPTHAALTKHLFAAGFSAQLVRIMVENLPKVENMEAGMEWVHSVLESNLPVIENEDALMDRGGVFALTGPTGVGKTTTTAKLAARCVMRFGASKVALLTTDSYRIGGHEQLRIFGKILGVSVHAVKDGADLQLALTELRNKHIVLIDTIGMSQRDRSVSDQIAMLCGAGQPVQRLLLLNATSHGDTLNEVVQAYQASPDKAPLAGVILTKLDEATNLGSVLDTVIRYRLPVHYVSTGQKVPENLYVATRKFLIKSAFCIPRDGSPFVPHDDDIPALLSALSARSTAELHEVRFG